MNATFGTVSIALGMGAALLGVVTVGWGLARRERVFVRLARPYAAIMLGAIVLAFIAMERALITRDFTVLYVAKHGSTRTPALFNFAALWSSVEGSLLLWTLLLAGVTAAVGMSFRQLRRPRQPRGAELLLGDAEGELATYGWVMLTLFVICLFFFALMIGPANPFRTFVPPAGYDGPGPNPLLQNHILVAFHPPLLYLGYVGFAVPFAFAVASLVTGRAGSATNSAWFGGLRRWTLFSWICLTLGIILGGWWSYEVLGWGGYWAWDPVENASLLPWLTATAFLHSAMAQERREMFRVWNLVLVCATFALTILATFLTRSGVLDSVHAFGDSTLGPLLLGFFGVIVAVCLGLIGWRADLLRFGGRAGSVDRVRSVTSREGALLAGNLVFAAFASVVFLGTVFPLVTEALTGDRSSVGAPYFDRMAAPLAFAILALMGIGPLLAWRGTGRMTIRHRAMWPAWAGTGAVVVAVLVGARGLVPLVAFGLAAMAGAVALRQLALRFHRLGLSAFLGRQGGGMIVHVGVVILAFGFVASSAYTQQIEVDIREGESVSVAGHTVRFKHREFVQHPERREGKAVFDVDGEEYAPSLSEYPFGSQVIGTPSVRVSPVDDVYLALVRPPEEGERTLRLRILVRPLVVWLWIGGIVMAFGTLLAIAPGLRGRGSPRLSDERRPEPYRAEADPESEPARESAPALEEVRT